MAKQKMRLPQSHWLCRLKRVADHPFMNITAGAFLVGTGLFEGAASIYEELADVPIGGHHGMAVFGIIHILRTLPDLLEAMHFVEEGEEAREQELEKQVA